MRRISFFLLLMLGVAACGGSGATTDFDYTDVPTRVEIIATTGDIVISANVANAAGVNVQTTASGNDEATISESLTDGVLVMSDDCGDCGVNYSVELRGDIEVVATTETGSITLIDVNGDITVMTTTGSISLQSINGDISAAVETGNIVATRLNSRTATFTATTGDLDVTFDEPVDVLSATTTTGDVTAQLPDDAYAITASTENGGTDLAIDSDATSDREVTLQTENGDIELYRR